MTTSYTSCASKPEELVICTALEASDYSERYEEKVRGILDEIKDDNVRQRVKETLGSFEKGSDGKLSQSSPYRLVVLQEILPEGKVLVSRPRLQIAKENSDFMSGFYVDCDLNLVTSQGEDYKKNPVLANKLKGDLEEVGIDLKVARLIPYKILTSEVNGNSPSGLVFKLSAKGKDTAKNLVLNTDDFKWCYKPSVSGLFRAYLYTDGNWGSSIEYLASSSGVGRVVVETTSEAGSREFERLRKQATDLYEKQLQERKALVGRLLA